MTEQQSDRALLKSKLLQYLNLFVDAIEDKEKTGDVERDIEFKAILQAIDDLSFDKFERDSFRLTFSFYTLYLNYETLHEPYRQRPYDKVIHVIDSLSSRMACTLRTRTHLKVLGIEPPQDADAFRIYTVEAVKADARDQIAKYLSIIPTIKAEPSTLEVEGVTPASESKSILSVSFDETNLTIIINGKAYPFIETIKKHRKNKSTIKLTEAYRLFKFLYENQHRRIKKGEIVEALQFGNDEQRVFNAASKLRKVVRDSPYDVSTEKEYGVRGGYLLVVKNTDLESG